MIRRATRRDLPEITRVRTSVRENHLSVAEMAERGITPGSVGTAMDTGTLLAWVMECDEEIVAFAMADRETGKLFALFTAPAHEGKGHGTALLNVAEDALAAAGFATVELDTGESTRAAQFYARRGYIITGRGDGDLFMQKSLCR
jgi:GNAT superfamily N-acetyltransferase